MNEEYLHSIINLYLSREKDKYKTNLAITKKNDKVLFSFNMKQNEIDKTDVQIPFDNINIILGRVLFKFKKDLMIIDEKYNYDKVNETCYYYVLFNNGRTLSFDGFSVLELNNIRNVLYNIEINKEEIRVSDVDEEKQVVYKPQFTLQQAGFSSYGALFLTVLFFADVLVISLWIFKMLLG
jgi:hypothetical protein